MYLFQQLAIYAGEALAVKLARAAGRLQAASQTDNCQSTFDPAVLVSMSVLLVLPSRMSHAAAILAASREAPGAFANEVRSLHVV